MLCNIYIYIRNSSIYAGLYWSLFLFNTNTSLLNTLLKSLIWNFSFYTTSFKLRESSRKNNKI